MIPSTSLLVFQSYNLIKFKGICFENGYDGIATCYLKESKSFDWGTLYKNPTFTYGYNAYGPNNLKQ